MKVGITGVTGFIGSNLAKAFSKAGCELIPFKKTFFCDPRAMRRFTEECDAVIHLAGISRHEDGDLMYRTNTALAQTLANSLTEHTRVYLGSTTHIDKDLPYHRSKRESERILGLSKAKSSSAILMPNTFGPGGKPFYNSVVSTFCNLAAHCMAPEKIDTDAILKLIYIDDLCRKIVEATINGRSEKRITPPHTFEVKLGDLWDFLASGRTPENEFELDLAITRASYKNK